MFRELLNGQGIADLLVFQPTAMERHSKAGEWFDDSEIFSWIGERPDQITAPSMRLYYRARELKNAVLDWNRVIPESVGNQRTRLALELLRDKINPTQEARAKSFKDQGGGYRATYYNYAKRLKGVAAIG